MLSRFTYSRINQYRMEWPICVKIQLIQNIIKTCADALMDKYREQVNNIKQAGGELYQVQQSWSYPLALAANNLVPCIFILSYILV